MNLFGPSGQGIGECPYCGADAVTLEDDSFLSPDVYWCQNCGKECDVNEVRRGFWEVLREKRKDDKVTEESSEPDSRNDPSLIKEAKGKDGTVRLYENRVEIVREGFFSTITHIGEGTQSLPLDSIGTVEYREHPSGYIEFLPEGATGKKSIMDIENDEYAVTFRKKDQDDFKEIKEKFYTLRNNPAQNDQNNKPIEILRERYARGEIDEDEFESRKQVLEE